MNAPRVGTGPLRRTRGRNTHLTSLAGKLRRDGATQDELAAKLKAENAENCSPPLDDAEVAKIVASVSRYPAGQPLGGSKDAAETLMQRALDQHFAGGKRLIFGIEGRFWQYDGRLWRVVPDQWVSGMVLETINSNPVKNQKTASLLSHAVQWR
jgi:hypothetical protein